MVNTHNIQSQTQNLNINSGMFLFQNSEDKVDYWKKSACGFYVLLVAQSYPTLCNPMNCSPPGSSVRGIFQTRILERVAISYSRDLPNPGSLVSPALASECFTTMTLREAQKLLSYLEVWVWEGPDKGISRCICCYRLCYLKTAGQFYRLVSRIPF